MRTEHEGLEDRLTELLRKQAESVPVAEATWTEMAAAPAERSQPRRPLRVAFGVAAIAAALLAVVLAGPNDPDERVKTEPAAQGEAQPAEPALPTTAPPPPTGGFRAETRQVSFTADTVTIEVGGRQFVTAAPIAVHSDPGNAKYTTLEVTWQEHGVEMRLYMYFNANDREWWSNEIRTYDGNPNGNWITYTGDFFRSPLGTPFTGDFTVSTPDAAGRLALANLRVEAFRKPATCATATGPFVLDPSTSPIVLEGYISGYGAGVQLLDAATCRPVADQDRFVYDWNPRDSAVVTVGNFPMPVEAGRRAYLTPVAPGRTTIEVTAHDPATGALVAETDIEVVVGEVKQPPPPAAIGGSATPTPSVTSRPPLP